LTLLLRQKSSPGIALAFLNTASGTIAANPRSTSRRFGM
jgi:hypothetical protein